MTQQNGSGTASGSPKEIALTLGCHSAVRLRLGAALEFLPNALCEKKLDALNVDSLVLDGTCKSLLEPIPCTLQWIVNTDLVKRTVAHPRPAVLVAQGGTYSIQEQVPGAGPESLMVNVFELGIAGVGRLGYTIQVQTLGTPTFELPADEEHGIRVELPIEIEVERPDDSAGAADKSSAAAGVGTTFHLTPRLSPAFDGHEVELSFMEVEGPEHRPIGGTEQTFQWTAGAPSSDLVWRAGMKSSQPDHPELAYAPHAGKEGVHDFTWQVNIRANEKRGETGQLAVSSGKLFAISHPRLEALTLDFESEDLVARARLSGFAPELEVELALQLYVMQKGPEPRKLWSFAAFMAEHPGQVSGLPPSIATRAVAKENAMECIVASFEGLQGEYEARFPQVDLFVGMSIAPGWTGRKQRVLQQLLAYQPNTLAEAHGDGFPPLSCGEFAPPSVATEVGSRLIDFASQASGYQAPVTSVPPHRMEEWKIFLGCIIGEAGGSHPEAIAGVAHTIMNRVGHEHWGRKQSVVEVITAKKQFESYESRTPNFLRGMRYEDDPSIDKDGGIARAKEIALPIFLNPKADRGHWVTSFYSPGLQRALSKTDGRSAVPDRSDFDDVTPLVMPTGSADFKFLRHKGDAARPNVDPPTTLASK